MALSIRRNREPRPFDEGRFKENMVYSYDALHRLPRDVDHALFRLYSPPGVLEGKDADYTQYHSVQSLYLTRRKGGGWATEAIAENFANDESYLRNMPDDINFGDTRVSRRAFVAPGIVLQYGSRVPAYAKVFRNINPSVKVAAFAKVDGKYLSALRKTKPPRRSEMSPYYYWGFAQVLGYHLSPFGNEGRILTAFTAGLATALSTHLSRKMDMDLLLKLKLKSLLRGKAAGDVTA